MGRFINWFYTKTEETKECKESKKSVVLKLAELKKARKEIEHEFDQTIRYLVEQETK
jgi:hypothetical protein